MIGFWIAAAFLAAGAGALILYRAQRGTILVGAADPAIAAHQRALTEIDDLADRGLLGAGEHRDVRAEAARRLLAAADQIRGPAKNPDRASLALFAGVGVALGAVALYLIVGAPGAKDQPFAARMAAWRAHPEQSSPEELATLLRSIAAERPGDVEPLRRLAGLDMALGDPDGAIHVLRQAVVIAPSNTQLIIGLAEIMVVKAQGTVTPEAAALFQRAAKLDPANPVVRYYLARASIASGDVAGGLAQWRQLLNGAPAVDRSSLEQEIAAVEKAGHLPLPADGAPRAGSDGQQQATNILAMVEGLDARLRARPDDPGGWVRLVRAYTVLGETRKRDAALNDARRRYADKPDVIKALDRAVGAPSDREPAAKAAGSAA